MRIFFIQFIFIFFTVLPTISSADSIFDLKINGMSIGDSLLDHFDENEIKDWERTDYSGVEKDRTFVQISTDVIKFQIYNRMSFHIKPDDKNYAIYGMSAVKMFGRGNIELCLSLKEKIVEGNKSQFNNTVVQTYESPYEKLDDGRSVAYVTDFKFKNGNVRFWCVDWSKETEEKRNWSDNFQYNMNHKIYMDWLNR